MNSLFEMLVEDHQTDGLRSGEGSAVALRDGSILLVYTDFDGGGDFSAGRLVQRRSTNGGRTWSKQALFKDLPAGSVNLMSVSLLRMADGRLGCVYIHKMVRECDDILFVTSSDEGKTWTEPRSVTNTTPGYYCVNNDRLVQLSSGRLLIPYALHKNENDKFDQHGCLGCFISDDSGDTWRFSRKQIILLSENVPEPRQVSPGKPPILEMLQPKGPVVQEPGVIETADGRVMMWARSNSGRAYRTYSKDGGETWEPLAAISEFAMPCGPQSIYRLPGTRRMIMFYNDRQDLPFDDARFQWRTPLTVATSDDEGLTWKKLADIEDDSRNYCYLSACFHAEEILLTYYESGEGKMPDGSQRRRNLASLKIKGLAQSFCRAGINGQ